jgi:predicted phosphoribosyltransferase
MTCMEQYPGRPIGSGRLFVDRRDAGAVLSEWLAPYAGKGALVLGIPRGGLIVAAEVATRLDAGLEVIVARKLGAPGRSELAIGAVTAGGGRWLDDALIGDLGVQASYIEAITAGEMAEARRREDRYRGGRPGAPLRGRTVILVDDGLETGATMRAAIRAALLEGPARLVVAVPVGSKQACEALLGEADDVVCPYVPERFHAVGQFYINFESVEDADVEGALAESRPAGAPERPVRSPRPASPEARTEP